MPFAHATVLVMDPTNVPPPEYNASGNDEQDVSPPPTTNELSLDPSIITIWRIKLGAVAALLTFGAFFYDVTRFFGANETWIPAGGLTLIVLLLTATYALGWPRLRYRYWSFEMRPEELHIQRGVITRVRTVVPLRRIQHLDVSQDILEREFALGRLIIHTAGSRSSDVAVPGLPLEQAERIRDEIKQYILEDPLMEEPV